MGRVAKRRLDASDRGGNRRGQTGTTRSGRVVAPFRSGKRQGNRRQYRMTRPRRVFPSLLRTDWDSKLVEAGLEWLSRTAA